MHPRALDAEYLKLVFLIRGEQHLRAVFRLGKDCYAGLFDHNQIRRAYLVLLNFFKTFYIGANLLRLSFSFVTTKSYGFHRFHRGRISGRRSAWLAGTACRSRDSRRISG